MSGNAENLDREQMIQAIEFFMYRCSPQMRAQLMANLPQVYNAYHNQEIVRVSYVNTDRPVRFTESALTDNGFEQVPVTYPKGKHQ